MRARVEQRLEAGVVLPHGLIALGCATTGVSPARRRSKKRALDADRKGLGRELDEDRLSAGIGQRLAVAGDVEHHVVEEMLAREVDLGPRRAADRIAGCIA